MENTERWFKPSEGFEKIYFDRYDPDENTPGYLHPVGFSNSILVKDFLEVNTLNLKKKVTGLIVVSGFDYKYSNHEITEKSYLESSIRELQSEYPDHIIMIPQSLESKEMSYAKGFCIDIDAFTFKSYPYNNFIRWVYPNSYMGEIKDLSQKLSKIRFEHATRDINDIIVDLEKCGSVHVDKVKGFYRYLFNLFNTWF